MSQLDTLAEMVANLTYGLESMRKQLEENQLVTMSRLSLVELSNRQNFDQFKDSEYLLRKDFMAFKGTLIDDLIEFKTDFTDSKHDGLLKSLVEADHRLAKLQGGLQSLQGTVQSTQVQLGGLENRVRMMDEEWDDRLREVEDRLRKEIDARDKDGRQWVRSEVGFKAKKTAVKLLFLSVKDREGMEVM